MRLRLTLLAFVLAAGAASATQARPTPAQLAARIQAHYDTVRDFTAEFTQTDRSALRPRAETVRGDVKIKKPLMMRWTYTSDHKNTFVSDGTNLYQHFPQDRYVVASPLPPDNQTSTWLLFLAGRGNLTRDFTATMPDMQPQDEWHLTLTPRQGREADFRSLTLQVSRSTLQFVGLEVEDDQGRTSTFRFTNLRENRGLSNAEFRFEIPSGVEVEWRK